MTGNRVLIDTSVSISLLQECLCPNICDRVEAMMSEAEICVPKIVLAELLQGARSEREIGTIESFFGAFTIVRPRRSVHGLTQESWLTRVKKKGKECQSRGLLHSHHRSRAGMCILTLTSTSKHSRSDLYYIALVRCHSRPSGLSSGSKVLGQPRGP